MPFSPSTPASGRGAVAVVVAAAVLASLPACASPFGLGLPSTRALESGAGDSIDGSASLEITGTYTASGVPWSIDLQFTRPHAEHVLVTQGTTHVEAIVIGTDAYFRGQEFLSEHLGSATAARTLARAAGNAWWRGSASDAPDLSAFTDGGRLRATFLGSAVTQRIDHVVVDGVNTADLSGPRADVYVAEAAPHQLVRLRLRSGAAVEGVAAGDLHYSSFNRDFGIVAPTDVIDFSNLSTLPPLYTVVSVDTSGCGTPCVVSATVKNLGGSKGASGPSTVTFTMTDSASGKVAGSCKATVQPDVAYNSTTTVRCTIDLNGQQENAAIVTATADNPGHV